MTDQIHIDWYGTFVWTPAICNPAFQKSENRPDEQYESDFERYGTGITNTLDDPSTEGEYVTQEELLVNLAAGRSDAEVRTEITNTSERAVKLYVEHTLLAPDGTVKKKFCSEKQLFLPGERKILTASSGMLDGICFWSFDDPVLYTVESKLYANGEEVDEERTEFGFRSVQFKLDGFYLNGRKVLLDGANVHQDHGRWADAVTRQGHFRDVAYVKEAGFNFIRGSHYPHAPAFAQACDRLGVGLWSEGGLWSIGGCYEDDTVRENTADWLRSAYPIQEAHQEAYEQSCREQVAAMIRINRNHPSVLVWSVGNEAFFSDDSVREQIRRFAGTLRDLAHRLDFTRKTGLGGTQRKNLNVLAVCDIAGGNGDGGTAAYTNFYLPHIVSEYSSFSEERPGCESYAYDQIEDRKDPARRIRLAATACVMPDDFAPDQECIISDDGTTDIQVVVCLEDEQGRRVNDSRGVVLEVVSGTGVFPTGKTYAFEPGVTIRDGLAAIEFRSYYPGTALLQAWMPDSGLRSNLLTVRIVSADGMEKGTEPKDFFVMHQPEPVSGSQKEEQAVLDVACNRQSCADSFFDDRHRPVMAIDGDPSSFWQAKEAGPGQSWQVFLESTYCIEAVHVNQGEDAAAFELYWLDENGRWIQEGSFDGADREIHLDCVYTSCLRLVFTGVKAGSYAKLYEMKAYGRAKSITHD